MNLLFKISSRNILRHKGKSIAIGMILFLGVFFMTMGEAVITGMDIGIQENFVNGFMGDITIMSTNQYEEDVISGGPKVMEVIPDYELVLDSLNTMESVDKFVGLTIGIVMTMSEYSDPGYLFLLGVDMDEYQKMFNTNIVLTEGNMLKSGETGLMINSAMREELYGQMDLWLLPEGEALVETNLTDDALSNIDNLVTQEDIVIMGFGENTSLDLRVPVKGVMKYDTLNFLLRQISVVDIESFRQCFGYVTASDSEIEVSEENQGLLEFDEGNLDDLFSTDFSFGMVDSSELEAVEEPVFTRTETIKEDFYSAEKGSFNVIFLKLKDGYDLDDVVEKMNEDFIAAGLEVKAVDWKAASGQVAQMADLARISLYVFVYLLYLVAIIVIMNTLSMTAMERVTEIGMMRAVGAKKGFIAKMFVSETAVLSFIFGTIGIFTAVLVTAILRSANIPTTNDFTGLMFGGDTFRPTLSVWNILRCYLQLFFVTVISVIYPMILARKITPLQAISRD